MKASSGAVLIVAVTILILSAFSCAKEAHPPDLDEPQSPECAKGPHVRVDAHQPQVMVTDWGEPIRLAAPTNTSCPEDAAEISRDGRYLYFYFTKDLFDNLPPEERFSPQNGTYQAERTGGPGDFAEAEFFDLGQGTDQSLDGELSFTPDGRKVYFHSTRADNLRYQQVPPVDDFLDVYVADVTDGQPGPARNLGPPVNSAYVDGEETLHPDGQTLYFCSSRPGGPGGIDIWRSTVQDGTWSTPVCLSSPINSPADELQPAFTSDGQTIYFVSDREPSVGSAIYRSNLVGDSWTDPDLVIKGIVGEPSLTSDGRYLYFVHVLTDPEGVIDADVWYCERTP
jgi:Tol biopolymer transport system component